MHALLSGVEGIVASGIGLLGGFMPSEEVLARSDFATPLDAATRALYTRLIAAL